MRYIVRATSAILFTLAFAAPAVRADVPQNLTVQGRLTDAAGDPVPAGLKIFTFKIFDAEVGGAENWPGGPGESQTLSTDADGLWTARVGAIIGLNEAVFKDTSSWLQVTVDDGVNPAETLPRIKLNTNPFTYRAAWAQDADALGGNTPADLTDQFVNTTGDTMSGFLTVEFPNGNGIGSNLRVNNLNDGHVPRSLGFNTIGIVGEGASDGSEGKFGVIGFGNGDDGFATGVFGEAYGAGQTNIGIYGFIGSATADENFSGYFWGGDFGVFSPATGGDSSVRLPNNAIGNGEILDEPGIAHGYGGNVVSPLTLTMQDLATVTITIPTDGYILLTGSTGIETSGQTTTGFIYLQIDETAGGGQTSGYWSALAGNVGTLGNLDWSGYAQRVYFKTKGTYTFRFEGLSSITTGAQRAYNPRVTALFIPTSYGAVSTVASSSNAGQFEVTKVPGAGIRVADGAGAGEDADLLVADLRELEVRAAKTALAAEEARLELLQAQSRTGLREGPIAPSPVLKGDR